MSMIEPLIVVRTHKERYVVHRGVKPSGRYPLHACPSFAVKDCIFMDAASVCSLFYDIRETVFSHYRWLRPVLTAIR